MIITYRTDRAALEKVVPKPLEIVDPVVKYEFIRMPDSTGFGDYTESGQVIPVRLAGEMGGFVHAMFLDDDPPIAGGRELWGFPKKLAFPSLRVERDTLLGTLDYGRLLRCYVVFAVPLILAADSARQAAASAKRLARPHGRNGCRSGTIRPRNCHRG